jgi:soluble lytic murein transglycosylase-like protein
MKRRLLAGLIPAALALSGPVHADIYAFVDNNGVRHLSNIPNDPRYKLVMRTPAYSKESTRPSSYAPSNLYAPGAVTFSPRNYTPRIAGTRAFRVNEQNRQRFAADVDRIATQYRLEPALMHAVISAESAYNPWAVSPKGAMGLMQLMPGTAERFGVSNPYDPIANMHGGARYLRWLLDRFNDTRLAVAGYNAGEGAVQKYGNQIPPYQETQTYVVRVLDFYQRYRTGGPSYSTVAYNAGGAAPTYNSGYSAYNNSSSGGYRGNTGGSGGYRGNTGGVTIITPRTNARPAGTTIVLGSAGSSAIPRTYLTPTGGRVVVGASGGAGRNSSQVTIRTNPNSSARVTAVVSTPMFAGNDK